MTWLLVIFAVGAFPPLTTTVDNIASEAECRQLGQQLVDRSKQANSSNRYAFECYGVNRTQQ